MGTRKLVAAVELKGGHEVQVLVPVRQSFARKDLEHIGWSEVAPKAEHYKEIAFDQQEVL